MDSLPAGVQILPSPRHVDPRGSLSVMFLQSRVVGLNFVQWNLSNSVAGSLRGVHVHPIHYDYLHVFSGRLTLGLHDLRPSNPEERTSCLLDLTPDQASAILIPPGVCHGFWFGEESSYLLGLSEEWQPANDLGCHFLEPELNLQWPCSEPLLSGRDAHPRMNYQQMRAQWLTSRQAAL